MRRRALRAWPAPVGCRRPPGAARQTWARRAFAAPLRTQRTETHRPIALFHSHPLITPILPHTAGNQPAPVAVQT